MSNVWYDMMVDRCIDQVEELSDQEVRQMVPDYLDMCERSDINVSIDEARALAQDYLFGLEMADQQMLVIFCLLVSFVVFGFFNTIKWIATLLLLLLLAATIWYGSLFVLIAALFGGTQ